MLSESCWVAFEGASLVYTSIKEHYRTQGKREAR